MKFLENDFLQLRALEPEDTDLLYNWENDTTLWQVGNTLAPYSKFAIDEYLKEARLDIFTTRQLRLMIQKKNTMEAVGMVDLYDFDPHNRRAGIGILIDAKHQKKGIAYQTLQIIEKYTFEFLHFHQLYAHIPEKNHISLKLFSKLGYKPAGILNEWLYIGNEWQNVTIMQKIMTN